jgi:hypothetical protein
VEGAAKATVEKRLKKCTILLHAVSPASASKLKIAAKGQNSQAGLGDELGGMGRVISAAKQLVALSAHQA